MFLDVKKATTCAHIIATFERETTPDAEAASAGRAFARILRSNGVDFVELATGKSPYVGLAEDLTNKLWNLEFEMRRKCEKLDEARNRAKSAQALARSAERRSSAFADENSALREQIKARDARIEELEQACDHWRRTAENARALNRDSEAVDLHSALPSRLDQEPDLSTADFLAAARAKFGRVQCKSALAHALHVSVKMLNAYLLIGWVPAHLAAKLAALTAEQLQPASRKHWSETDRAHLQMLLKEGHPDHELARTLSDGFGRRIFESGIARQRRRIQAKLPRSGTLSVKRTAAPGAGAALH